VPRHTRSPSIVGRFGRAGSAIACTVALAAGTAAPAPAVGPPNAKAAPPWTILGTPATAATSTLLDSIAVVAPGQVFAAGYTQNSLPGAIEWRTLVERWTGTAWQSIPTPDRETAPAQDFLRGVAGSSATDVWAVGQSATAVGRSTSIPLALHYDGQSWTIADVPDPSGGTGAGMSAVVSLGPDDVWAVGTAYPLEAAPAVYHYDGQSWTATRLPVPQGCNGTNFTQLTALTATPGGDLYAGGDCPTKTGRVAIVLRRTGATWTTVARGLPTSDLTGMTSTADGTVWAVGTQSVTGGSRGFALTGSGRTWTRRSRPAQDQRSESFSGVAATPAGVVAVGSTGPTFGGGRVAQVLTWAGTGWRSNPVGPAQPRDAWLVAAASAGADTWAVGRTFGLRGLVPITARPGVG
jgi:hypothetical protein